jgi:predicted Zn-dependent peptidase
MVRVFGPALLLAFLVGTVVSAGPTTVAFSDAKLKNGLRVIVSEDHTAPTVSVVVIYNVGSADERPGRTGFAHLFEHMMFKGSENAAPGEHPALIFNNGGTMNGTTNQDRTLYYESLPANQLELVLFLEGDRMRSLVINKPNLDNQRNAVQEERRLRVDNQPYGQTFERTQEQAYDNPAYKHSTIGSMADLNAASVEDVAAFFKTYYAPNNAILSIVGDVDSKKTMALVDKYFGTIPSQPQPARPDLTEPAHTAERRSAIDDPLARLGRVDVAWIGPKADSPDFDALNVLTDVLAGGRSARLNQVLVREKQIATSTGIFMDETHGPTLFQVFAMVAPGKSAADVEAAIYDEVEKIKTAPVADWELDKARNSARRNAATAILSSLQRAFQLGQDALFYNDPNRINTDTARTENITAADLQRVAGKYLTKENRSVIITTPKPAAPNGGQR